MLVRDHAIQTMTDKRQRKLVVSNHTIVIGLSEAFHYSLALATNKKKEFVAEATAGKQQRAFSMS